MFHERVKESLKNTINITSILIVVNPVENYLERTQDNNT